MLEENNHYTKQAKDHQLERKEHKLKIEQQKAWDSTKDPDKGWVWTKTDTLCETHSSDMVDENGPDEVVLPLVLLAQGGALLLCVLHQALNEIGAALTDYWSDGAVVLHQQVAVMLWYWGLARAAMSKGVWPCKYLWKNNELCKAGSCLQETSRIKQKGLVQGQCKRLVCCPA